MPGTFIVTTTGRPRRRRTKGEKLKCPNCGSLRSTVVPWRQPVPSDVLERRRRCDACGCVYETKETVTAVVELPRAVRANISKM